MPPKLTEPSTFMFADDGWVPNNPRLPFLVYRNAISLAGTPHPEEAVEKAFRANGWGDMWRNGIFPYVHYHSMIHEGLGVARGRAKVRFGGSKGEEIDLMQGRCRRAAGRNWHQGLWSSPDLMVIGAYPKGGRYDLCRGSKAEHAKAVETIPRAPLPETDPVFGKNGPLIRLWRD